MNFIFILVISILGPIIGSAIGIFIKPSKNVLQNMMAFAGGVMLTISLYEMIPESIMLSSIIITSFGILTGSIIMYLLDKLIPHIHPELCNPEQGRTLKKTAIYLIIGIFLHNIPEGLAIATGFVTNTGSSLAIAIAIAVHNIPEGICTSAPYYFCTKKKLKSFLISSSTAIPIVIGFVIGKIFLMNLSNNILGFIMAATAGLMIYISGDELIPFSCNKEICELKPSHSPIFSLISGVIFVVLLSFL